MMSQTIQSTHFYRGAGRGSIPAAGGGLPLNWPNEPAGLTLKSEINWDTATPGAPWTNASTGSIILDGSAPKSASNVLQVLYPNGMVDGTGPVNYLIEQNLGTKLYVGFFLKVSNPWQGHSSNVNKIMFIWGAGDASSGPVLEMYGTAEPYHLRTALFEMGVSENYVWADQNVTNPAFTLGTWHLIEMYMEYSTTDSSLDGIYKVWLDGTLVTTYTDINYKHPQFTAVKFNPTWGGNTGELKSEDDYYWMDHIRVSNA